MSQPTVALFPPKDESPSNWLHAMGRENKNEVNMAYAPDEIALGKYHIRSITSKFAEILNAL